MTIKQKTGVANHQEASRNLLKAGSSSASAILHCSQRIVAVLCTYPPANNELVLHSPNRCLSCLPKKGFFMHKLLFSLGSVSSLGLVSFIIRNRSLLDY